MVQRLPERLPFGQVTVRLGFATQAQVDRALKIQSDRKKRGEKHKLIGIIMTEEGMISSEQLIKVLKYYDREDRESNGRGDESATP